jgi:signal transduction histidine kinase/ligand-binding sensor domain-containing protein
MVAQEQRIFQMVHTAWTAREGAPQSINSLAQTTDGTLWLATRDGLYSFDGLVFSVFHPVSGVIPRQNIQFLFAAKDGSLWAFGPRLRPIRIRDGIANVFDRVDHGTFTSLSNIQQESDQTLWAILNRRDLVYLGPDGIWHIAPGPKPNPDQLGALFIDSSDTLWLVADNLLYRRAKGQTEFLDTEIPVYGHAKLEEGLDHSIWIAGYSPVGPSLKQPMDQPPEVCLKHVNQFGKRLPNPQIVDDASDVVAASDGSVWLSHVGSGLQRLRPEEMADRTMKRSSDSPDLYGMSDGLVSPGYRELLRDRDGNIWVGGARGLDRFQKAILLPIIPNAIAGEWSVCTSPNGDVWLAVFDGFRAVVRGRRVIRLKDEKGVAALQCNKDGTVRQLDNSGIAEIRNDHIERLPLLPINEGYYDHYRFTSFVTTPDGALIAGTTGSTENRLWIYKNKKWKPFLPTSAITRIRSMFEDSRNDLYLGTTDGIVRVLKAGTFDLLWEGSPGVGAVGGFSETTYGIFAFGENGIALQQHGIFQPLQFQNPDIAMAVTGLVEAPNQDIWMNGSRAIARIPAQEILSAASDRAHSIVAHEIREADFSGSDMFSFSRNSAQIDTQGRLWFPTSNGVVYIDPRHLDRQLHLPLLSIRSVTADGRLLSANRTFPPRPQALNVRYFGLNLSDPGSVIYRYRLDGSDESWQNVGHRTEAIYTHLRPGKYVFKVKASNGDGIWTQPLASETFAILPAFYQTWWFETLIGLAVALVLWLGLSLRVSYVAATVRMRAEERAEERVRIARELHDTLLQGIQGLLLSFHTAASKVPPEHESKEALNKALSAADRIILEGRDRVNRLRSEHLQNGQLEPAIREVADDLTALSKMEFMLEKTGTPQPLDPEVMDEVYFIIREALTNSFRHSGGSQVVVALDYGRDRFRLGCRDNGSGFAGREFQEYQTNGHWGLRGMSERAQRIGADLSFNSSPGEGVQVSIVVPAARAYVRNNGFRSLFRRSNTS